MTFWCKQTDIKLSLVQLSHCVQGSGATEQNRRHHADTAGCLMWPHLNLYDNTKYITLVHCKLDKEKLIYGVGYISVKKKWWQHHQTGATVDTTRPQRKRATKEYLEKKSGERTVDSRIQVQLEEDGDRAGWKWVVCSLSMFHWEWQGISQVKKSI